MFLYFDSTHTINSMTFYRLQKIIKSLNILYTVNKNKYDHLIKKIEHINMDDITIFMLIKFDNCSPNEDCFLETYFILHKYRNYAIIK